MASPVTGDGRLELGDQLRALRPGTDEGHLSANHVPDLRQFVEARSAHPTAPPHYPAVVHDSQAGGPVGLRVMVHGPELGQDERHPIPTGPDLTEQHAATCHQPNVGRSDRQHRHDDRGGHEQHGQLDQALQPHLVRTQGTRADRHVWHAADLADVAQPQQGGGRRHPQVHAPTRTIQSCQGLGHDVPQGNVVHEHHVGGPVGHRCGDHAGPHRHLSDNHSQPVSLRQVGCGEGRLLWRPDQEHQRWPESPRPQPP